MQNTGELRNLFYSIEEKEKQQSNLGDLVRQLESQGKQIKNSYLPLKQQEPVYLKTTRGVGFKALKLCWKYFLCCLLVGIALIALYLILLIPSWIFGFGGAVDSIILHVLYAITLPAIWLIRFFLWVTSPLTELIPFIGLIREGLYESIRWFSVEEAAEGLYAVLIVVISIPIMFIVPSFILDIILIPMRKATNKLHNASIFKKNKEIEASKINALESWTRSNEYQNKIRSIEEVKSSIVKSEQAIMNNNIVHSSLKNRDSVVRLIDILETGRAYDLTSAINKMDEDRHNERLEQMQWEAMYREEQEAERRAAEARIAQERSEAILNQIANNTAQTQATANAIFWMNMIDLLDD